MTPEEFSKALNEIDDKYIEEARCYKMKKKISVKRIVAVAACAALVIAAFPLVKNLTSRPASTDGTTATAAPVIKLGESGKFTVLEVGDTDTDTNLDANHQTEIDIFSGWGYFTDSDKKNTTATVEISGKKWTGIYTSSKSSDYYQDDVDVYTIIGATRLGEFDINRETGVCTRFYITEGNEILPGTFTRDECYAKVLEHLKNYVDDIENYELSYEQYRGGNHGYYFVLRRIVEGIKTSDSVAVGIRQNGEIYTHLFQSMGTMADTDISAINMEALNAAVEVKIDAIYENCFNVEYTTEEMVLTKLADGSYAFDFNINVEASKTENGNKYNECCHLIVKVD